MAFPDLNFAPDHYLSQAPSSPKKPKSERENAPNSPSKGAISGSFPRPSSLPHPVKPGFFLTPQMSAEPRSENPQRKRKLDLGSPTIPTSTSTPSFGKPMLYDNTLMFNGIEYPLTPIGVGKAHKVYSILGDQTILQQKTNAVVLRTLNMLEVKPTLEAKQHLKDLEAYKNLEKNGVPLPKVYFDPSKKDPLDPTNGGFWFIEKAVEKACVDEWKDKEKSFEELGKKSQQLLVFVKTWIDKMFEEKKVLIPDFYPRNVMWKEDGSLCIIDFDIADEALLWTLGNYVKQWSAGNSNIQAYLMKSLPESLLEAKINLFA